MLITVCGYGREADRRHSPEAGIDLHPLSLRDGLLRHLPADVLLGQVQHDRLPAAEARREPAYQPAG
jgi:hypothetical protein